MFGGVFVSFLKDLRKMGMWFGMVCIFCVFFLLVGLLIVGVIIDRLNGIYIWVCVWVGMVVVLVLFMIMFVRIVVMGFKLVVKI